MSWELRACAASGRDVELAARNYDPKTIRTPPIWICLAPDLFSNCSVRPGLASAGPCWRAGCSIRQNASKSQRDRWLLLNFAACLIFEKTGHLSKEVY